MKTLFDGLYQLSLTKKRLNKDVIETFLADNGFSEWSDQMMVKLNSK